MSSTRRVVALAAFVLVGGGVWWLVSPSAPPPPGTGATQVAGGAAGLGIAPVRDVVGADDGESTVQFTVANESNRPAEYEVTTAELDLETGARLADSPADAGAWFDVPGETVRVPARTARPVSLRVSPPPDRGASQRRVGVTFAARPTSSAVPGDREDAAGVTLVPSITASVYVEGTGSVRREARFASVDLPWAATSSIGVEADVENTGTVTLVPGTSDQAIVASASGGARTALNGPVVRVGETGTVVGELTDLPVACWCAVRVDALVDEASGGTTTQRVLVLPVVGWVALIVSAAGGVLAGSVLLARTVVRRSERGSAP